MFQAAATITLGDRHSGFGAHSPVRSLDPNNPPAGFYVQLSGLWLAHQIPAFRLKPGFTHARSTTGHEPCLIIALWCRSKGPDVRQLHRQPLCQCGVQQTGQSASRRNLCLSWQCRPVADRYIQVHHNEMRDPDMATPAILASALCYRIIHGCCALSLIVMPLSTRSAWQ